MINYKIIPIITKDDKADDTLLFAAAELEKYLSKVSENEFMVIPASEYKNDDKKAIYVGVNINSEIPEVEDVVLDDAIYINVENSCGVISGTNPRAVLIACYRFLREIGFCFLRPGSDGEIYPESINMDKVFVCEKASYRHRGVCIEGSVFQKNLMDIIDWLPKVAMNEYFVQFQLPREFFDRWYIGETPYREKIELTADEIRAIVSLAEKEIEKRSLIYHGVGHGWTTEAFGIEGSSWSVHEEPALEYQDMLALVNGKRALWKGVPINTNLCYSNKIARRRVTDNIVKYIKAHKNVDYLHFWLADGTNNNCECEECRKLRTSDYYVMMLNELDEKLTKEGINTKIVFLAYVDLLWKPLVEKLKNKERFVLMFAPITRSYSVSYNTDVVGQMKPYELNRLEFPKNVEENLAYLYDWKKDFDGDSFDYDYHFIWDHYYDFAQFKHAKILCGDVKKLKDMGLNGLMSCQAHRVFLPTSLSMNVMAQALWDSSVDFDVFADNILKTEFGKKHGEVREYLNCLSENSCAEEIRGEKDFWSEDAQIKLIKAISVIDRFKTTVLERTENAESERIKKAWEKLKFHGELYSLMLEFYLEFSKNKEIGDFSHIKDFVLSNEVRFKDEFDAMYFLYIIQNDLIVALEKRK